MRQLLWKEWRERRVRLLCWGAIIVGFTACCAGPYFLGNNDFANPWPTLWLMIVSVFVGLGAYASELTPGRAAFAYSRPVSWKAILLSKLLSALACAWGAVLLGTLLFRLRCPTPYLPFIPPGHLALGALQLCWAVGGGYLCGLACSVVLPGIAGGILTLVGTVLIMAVAGLLVNSQTRVSSPIWLLYGWEGGMLLAAVLLLRFGMTLSTPQRIVRYARVYLPVAVCIMLLTMLLPEQQLVNTLGRQFPWFIV